MRLSLPMASTSLMPTQRESTCARSPPEKLTLGRFRRASLRGRRAGSPTAPTFWSYAWKAQRVDLSKPSLWKLSLLGGDPQKLRDEAVRAYVSPDGSRVIYLPGPAFGSELWVMDSEGANPQKVVSAGRRDQPTRWKHNQPDGLVAGGTTPGLHRTPFCYRT